MRRRRTCPWLSLSTRVSDFLKRFFPIIYPLSDLLKTFLQHWSMAGVRACSRKNECASITAFVCLNSTTYTQCPRRSLANPFLACRQVQCRGCRQGNVLDLHGWGVRAFLKMLFAFLRNYEPYLGHFGHDDYDGLQSFYGVDEDASKPLHRHRLGDLIRGQCDAVLFLNAGRQDRSPVARKIKAVWRTISGRTHLGHSRLDKVTMSVPEAEYDQVEARPMAFHCNGWPPIDLVTGFGHHYIRCWRMDFREMPLHQLPLAMGKGFYKMFI